MAGRTMPIEDQLEMWETLKAIQEAFPYTLEGFLKFANYCVNELIRGRPDINRVQADMCKWLFAGPQFRMIMAQRGQAKTTITAIYAVFRLIHEPYTRILIFSAGGKMAKEIASWVIQIIHGLDILEVMRADKNAGDRASVEGYDVHWVLKGAEKSPSVKCLGIDSNAQGSRADIVIADDIESMKNARTVAGREILEELTTEFESICQSGDIIYLGTPQSSESIYNNLPSRGYGVRIWTGRYPTHDQEESYGEFLAPMLKEDMVKFPHLRTGGGAKKDQGQPTCPEMFTDEALIGKEQSQGTSKFQLQYMLNTALADAERFPLKIYNLIVADFNNEQGPVLPVHSNDMSNIDKQLPIVGNRKEDKLYWAVKKQYEWKPFERSVMYIDPAGGGKNADETGYAVIKLIGSHVYITAWGGVKGGYEEENLEALVDIAKEQNVKRVLIEKNFGNGAHASMLKPIFTRRHPVEIEEVWETGQKELRIIDVIEPLLSTHRLVISPQVVLNDHKSTRKYAKDVAVTYRGLNQMAMITRDKGCLRHDDRLDALAGAIRDVTETIDFDTATVIAKEKEKEAKAWLEQWRSKDARQAYLGNAPKGRKRNRF